MDRCEWRHGGHRRRGSASGVRDPGRTHISGSWWPPADNCSASQTMRRISSRRRRLLHSAPLHFLLFVLLLLEQAAWCRSAAVQRPALRSRPSAAPAGPGARLTVCPGGDELDAGSRAYGAPVVFEGKARSKSDIHAATSHHGGYYRVTFDVVAVLKGDVHAGSQVRFEFVNPATSLNGVKTWPSNHSALSAVSAATVRSRTSSKLTQLFRGHGCVVAADVRAGRRYLVFANQFGAHNLTAIGPPLLHNKKTLKEVRATLCHKCARTPVAVGLEDVTAKTQGRLTLRCRTRGNPVPAVTWFKDGQPIHATKRVRIKTKRRRSTLRIRCVKEEDAGVYECRPTNVVGTGTPSKAKVTVIRESRLAPRPGNGSSSLWPLIALPCPIDSFCLNGGTCKYYEAVGELVCQCAEGYKGQRCENKDIYNLGKGAKCKGGKGGPRCHPSVAAGSPTSVSSVYGGSLGPTAAAGWAALPSQFNWWHWLANEVDLQRCQDD